MFLPATERQKARSSNKKRHFALFLALLTHNGTAKVQIVAEQDAFRVIACIVYAQLLSKQEIVAQNKKTITSLGDRSPGRQIKMTRSDNKFAPANHIVQTNKITPYQLYRYISVTFFKV